MTNEEILANAPERATHYDSHNNTYIRCTPTHWYEWKENEWDDTVYSVDDLRSLSDLRRIVELSKRAEQLERERDDLNQEMIKRKSAYAVLNKQSREAEAHFLELTKILISELRDPVSYSSNLIPVFVYDYIEAFKKKYSDFLLSCPSDSLNKFAIEQQIKILKDFKNDSAKRIHENWIVDPRNGIESPGIKELLKRGVGTDTSLVDAKIHKLRQQLNGGENDDN